MNAANNIANEAVNTPNKVDIEEKIAEIFVPLAEQDRT